MKKIIFTTAVVLSAGFAVTAFRTISRQSEDQVISSNEAGQTSNWKLDKTHSNVIFSVSHLVVSDVQGSFKSFDGSMDASKPDFSDAKITFSIDVNSVSTDNENRDNHLKSDDFFNAAKFPQIKFVSTSITALGNGKYKLVGDLTIRDVTKSVPFDVTYGGTVNAMGGTHAGFKAKTTINRFDYNLKWDKTTEAGGLVVGKDVDITINVDMKKS